MRPLLFEVGPGLAFRFEGFDGALARGLRSSLSWFAVDEPAADGRSHEPLAIAAQPPPEELTTRTPPRLARHGLRVTVTGTTTLFESPGVVGWCRPRERRGGIHVETGAPQPLERFLAVALAPLLFELAAPLGWLGLHAAAVAIGGRGVLLPAPSGAGKSTVFRSCLFAGQDGLSDDLVWLRQEPSAAGGARIHPFPKGGPGAAPLPTVPSAPLAAIVCPVVAGRTSSRLEPMAAAEALDALLEQSGLLGPVESTRRQFGSLVRLADAVPAYRLLAGSDSEAAPGLLARLAEGSLGAAATGPRAVVVQARDVRLAAPGRSGS